MDAEEALSQPSRPKGAGVQTMQIKQVETWTSGTDAASGPWDHMGRVAHQWKLVWTEHHDGPETTFFPKPGWYISPLLQVHAPCSSETERSRGNKEMATPEELLQRHHALKQN